MEPIINPLWFYFVSLCDKISGIAIALAIICGIITVVYGIVYICTCYDFDSFNKEQKLKHNKNIKKLIFATVAFSFLFGITPSKDTCYKMAAASYVTPDNLTKAGETAEDVIDYIVNKVDQLIHGDNDESNN